MLKFLLGGAALAAMVPALAQTPAPPTAPVTPYVAPVAPAPPAPPMVDRVDTRDEMVAKVREHFAQLDANRDNYLTREEADAGRKIFKERIRPKLGERKDLTRKLRDRDPSAAFDRLDTNKDGSISRDEFAQHREHRIERRMVLKDGKAETMGAHDGGPRRMMRMHRMGGTMMGGHLFDMADANKDGRVSLQEATDTAAKHFDMADANRDGRITPDERRQMHRQMIEKRRAPKAG